ncbi:MAG TPA: hypothetical protein VNC60_06985, partial [Actinomycetota bacterium]|nr:hypothetical protein [Actinomycetota bacterium]
GSSCEHPEEARVSDTAVPTRFPVTLIPGDGIGPGGPCNPFVGIGLGDRSAIVVDRTRLGRLRLDRAA